MNEENSSLVPPDESQIPQQLDALNEAWLTEALRKDGHLPNGRVKNVEIERIGEGEGFLGVVARLRLDYEGETGRAPATLIVKLPSLIDSNRMLGELMGGYWREIHFYRELADRIPVNTPCLYYSDLTPDPMRPRLNMILRVVELLPAWLVDKVMTQAKKVVGQSEHRYILLIEDLSPALAGDQLSGGSPERCEAILSTVARMHADFWQNPMLDSTFWITDPRVTVRSRHQMYLDARPAFIEKYEEQVGEFGMKLLNWYDKNGVRLQRLLYRQTPVTLMHGDLRLDNIFFDETASDTRIILADWQMTARGPAAEEVAYLLGGTLDVDTPAHIEEALLHHYHTELLKAGVANYSFERFLKDYQRGMMVMLRVHGNASIDVDVGEDRGRALMGIWLDRTLARLRNLDPDTLL